MRRDSAIRFAIPREVRSASRPLLTGRNNVDVLKLTLNRGVPKLDTGKAISACGYSGLHH